MNSSHLVIGWDGDYRTTLNDLRLNKNNEKLEALRYELIEGEESGMGELTK